MKRDRAEREPLLPGPGKATSSNVGINDNEMRAPFLEDAEPGEEKTKNQLGTINGVYVPCLLNILGAVLFMRIGYSVGYAGWLGTVLIFTFCEIVTVITALSFSAIVTNGKMAGGGAYYMISRSIGPAFGGATGFLFYLCYVVNCAFNCTAFVDDIMSTFFPHAPSTYTYYWYHGTMVLLLAVALNGAGAFAKVNVFLFVALVASIITTFASLTFGHAHEVERLPALGKTSCHSLDSDLSGNATIYYNPPRSSMLEDNFYWEWTDNNPLVQVVALIFTSTCGVMEGANLSGDLKNPASSLPKGTLSAMATSFTTYVLFATFLALCYDRQSLRCEYLILQKTAVSPYVVVVGIAMATLSTSLGAMFGAARILQAIARDNIFPISFFKQGARKGDEPQFAVILTFLLAQTIIYLPTGPSVNAIGGILTDFFLTAYAFVNLSQVLLCWSGAPNYRPTFKWCPWWLSLIGFILSYTLMWYLQPVYAAVTCGLWLVMFIYVKLSVGERLWGDIVQGVLYGYLTAGLRRITPRKESAKFWRSSLLVLVRDTDLPLLTLAKYMSGTNDGMVIIGTPLLDRRDDSSTTQSPRRRRWSTNVDDGTQQMMPKHTSLVNEHKSAWLWLAAQAKLDAFVSVGCGSDLRQIYSTLISSCGLGGLVPNTVVFPFPSPFRGAVDNVDVAQKINEQISVTGAYASTVGGSDLGLNSPADYVRVLQTAFDCEKNIAVVFNSGRLAPLLTATPETPSTVDVWIIGGWGKDTLESHVCILLQHAHLLQKKLAGSILRVILLEQFTFEAQKEALAQRLADMVHALRIFPTPELVVLAAPAGSSVTAHSTWSMSVEHFVQINTVMSKVSRNSGLAFVGLPTIPDGSDAESATRYVDILNAMCTGMPPTVLMCKGEPGDIVSTHI
eukprot:m.174024 g.174024  ORF g.174024 m.174024 type:complete len:903 (+) comp24346_c0_seq1:73-2781(+)